MHICFTTLNYNSRISGGRNPSLEYISDELKRRGHIVTIISTPSNLDFTQREYGIVYTPSLKTPKSISGIYQIYRTTVKVHKSKKIDVIHACNREIAGLAGLLFQRIYKIPLVVWMYDLGFESQKFSLNVIRSPFIKFYLSNFFKIVQDTVLRGCNAITSIGPDITMVLKKNKIYYPKVFDIGNTVDIEKFSPNIDGNKIRREFLIENTPLVTFIGTLNPIKGADVFIRVASCISEAKGDVKFLIVGSVDKSFQSYERYLHKLVKELELSHKIIFSGIRRDIPEIMAASDCVVSLNRHDAGGIGNTWLEAMASGTPLITSNVASANYIIKDYENGMLVSYENPHEIANAVIEILKNKVLAKKIGKNARLTVMNNFSIETITTKLLKVYKNVLERDY